MANLFILANVAVIDLDHFFAIVQESLFDVISQICFHMTTGSVNSFKSSSSDNAAKVKWKAYRQMKLGFFDRLGASDTIDRRPMQVNYRPLTR
jgi:hypothetical protein